MKHSTLILGLLLLSTGAFAGATNTSSTSAKTVITADVSISADAKSNAKNIALTGRIAAPSANDLTIASGGTVSTVASTGGGTTAAASASTSLSANTALRNDALAAEAPVSDTGVVVRDTSTATATATATMR